MPKLILLFHRTNKQYEIDATQTILAGRSNQCNLVLPHYLAGPVNTISSNHFKIYYEGDKGFFLVDLYSTNGTQINNGDNLPPNKPTFLRHGDHITLSRQEALQITVLLDRGDAGTDTIGEDLINFELAKAQSGKFLNLSQIRKTEQIMMVGLHFDDQSFFINGQPIPETHLTEIEYDLLKYLYRNAGRVCTYAELSEHVWGWAEKVTIAQAVKKLRQKLNVLVDTAGKRHIQTKRGVGYICITRG